MVNQVEQNAFENSNEELKQEYERKIADLEAINKRLAETVETLTEETEYWKEQSFQQMTGFNLGNSTEFLNNMHSNITHIQNISNTHSNTHNSNNIAMVGAAPGNNGVGVGISQIPSLPNMPSIANNVPNTAILNNNNNNSNNNNNNNNNNGYTQQMPYISNATSEDERSELSSVIIHSLPHHEHQLQQRAKRLSKLNSLNINLNQINNNANGNYLNINGANQFQANPFRSQSMSPPPMAYDYNYNYPNMPVIASPQSAKSATGYSPTASPYTRPTSARSSRINARIAKYGATPIMEPYNGGDGTIAGHFDNFMLQRAPSVYSDPDLERRKSPGIARFASLCFVCLSVCLSLFLFCIDIIHVYIRILSANFIRLFRLFRLW